MAAAKGITADDTYMSKFHALADFEIPADSVKEWKKGRRIPQKKRGSKKIGTETLQNAIQRGIRKWYAKKRMYVENFVYKNHIDSKDFDIISPLEDQTIEICVRYGNDISIIRILKADLSDSKMICYVRLLKRQLMIQMVVITIITEWDLVDGETKTLQNLQEVMFNKLRSWMSYPAK